MLVEALARALLAEPDACRWVTIRGNAVCIKPKHHPPPPPDPTQGYEAAAAYAATWHQARIDALDQAAKTRLRVKSAAVLQTAHTAVLTELARLDREDAIQAGPSRLFAGDAAVKAYVLMNEADMLRGVIDSTLDLDHKTWRDSLKDWNREPAVTMEPYRTDQPDLRLRFSDKMPMGGSGGGFEWRGISGTDYPWPLEHIAEARDALDAVPPLSPAFKSAILLLPVSSLDVGGLHINASRATAPATPGSGLLDTDQLARLPSQFDAVALIFAPSSKEHTIGHTVIHELGHGVDDFMRHRAAQVAVADGGGQDTWQNRDRGIQAYKADKFAMIGGLARAEAFQSTTGRWGGANELFAEDFAEVFGQGFPRADNHDFGAVGHLTPTQVAAFRAVVLARAGRRAP